MKYTEINSKTIDKWVDEGWEWGVPISEAQFALAKSGQWSMLLTPTKPVPTEWFPNLVGKQVLGLASGGGQQMPIFAALGANCTLLDYSLRQVETDLAVAAREGYTINAIRADMTQALPFADSSFDLVFHPVSNCYIEDVMHVWRECYRILKPGGRLMAGLNNGVNYLFDEADEKTIKYKLPFNPLANPELLEVLRATDSGIQFSHTLEDQIRGQLKVGFKLLDLYEDTDGSGLLHEHGVPTFWATLVEKQKSHPREGDYEVWV
ncbi:MAG: class I SAM-dependent methyltransferase [Thermaerobacter sp.]|nr:class I SAM-dependent methyltransferase [Thermaerobacter sp.]